MFDLLHQDYHLIFPHLPSHCSSYTTCNELLNSLSLMFKCSCVVPVLCILPNVIKYPFCICLSIFLWSFLSRVGATFNPDKGYGTHVMHVFIKIGFYEWVKLFLSSLLLLLYLALTILLLILQMTPGYIYVFWPLINHPIPLILYRMWSPRKLWLYILFSVQFADKYPALDPAFPTKQETITHLQHFAALNTAASSRKAIVFLLSEDPFATASGKCVLDGLLGLQVMYLTL